MSYKYKDYIRWSHAGQTFTIINKDDFVAVVLKPEFNSTKFLNFQRRLNMYGFRKYNNHSLNSKNKEKIELPIQNNNNNEIFECSDNFDEDDENVFTYYHTNFKHGNKNCK